MSGKKRFEPETITAALKVLRALPVKDNRKTAREALAMLKGGIQDALDKGYDRTEIRKAIATADLPISSTTFNDFVLTNLPQSAKGEAAETGKDAPTKRKASQPKPTTPPEQTENTPPVKPESPAVPERKAAPVTPATTAAPVAPVKQATPQPTPAQLEALKKMPSYFTPDLPDSEL
ncbi:MAG: hypothetical protein LBV80_00820 [Deltaproteobacteria bacterium]|jgi:outer membrane biosynthesis protein TonB|nr:hypothetical protein [Deltaproteobacteria bacterium]